MARSWFSSLGDRARSACRIGAAGVVASALLAAPLAAQTGAARAGSAPGPGESLLEQAAAAERDLRIGPAVDRLYQLLIEHPGTPDATAARLRLARLLALSGRLPQAILQCQLLRDELPPGDPQREEALALSTVLQRRLRAGRVPAAPYFSVTEPVPARGVQAIDEPRAILFESEERFLLHDEGAGRVYRAGPESGGVVPAPPEPTAIATAPGGNLFVAGKTGLVAMPAGRTSQLTATWGGRARQLKKVRSMAALPDGSLLVIDRDYQGLLRCQLAGAACAPWGPAGKHRVVRVGPTGWVYLLDDRGEVARVIDAAQRQITVVGPIVGGVKLEKIADIALDGSHGLYLLDTDLKRVCVVHFGLGPDGRIAPLLTAAAALPQQGDRALKNASAIGVSPSGSLYVAGKSSSRVMRFR
jgi:hypothetical protein